MELKQLADILVQACKTGAEADLLDNHYAPDAVSVEAQDMGDGREVKGLDGIRGKHAWWNENFEVHSHDAEGPFLHGDDRFSVVFSVDCTNKVTSERTAMREVAVYHVAEGKIVREEFFY